MINRLKGSIEKAKEHAEHENYYTTALFLLDAQRTIKEIEKGFKR